MRENVDSIDCILLENIEKEIPINFSLLTTPVKDTPSVSKTSAISELENYIAENYEETAKIQLKQALLREVKQQLLYETKKGHLDELLQSSRSNFLGEEVQEKNNVIRTLLSRNSCECKSSSPCESPKLDKIPEKKNVAILVYPLLQILSNQLMNASSQN